MLSVLHYDGHTESMRALGLVRRALPTRSDTRVHTFLEDVLVIAAARGAVPTLGNGNMSAKSA